MTIFNDRPLYSSDFAWYQNKAASTAANLGQDRESRVTMALGLTGESGEAADLIKKYWAQGHDLDWAALHEELGDILWYVAGMATACGWDLYDIAKANLEKLAARYPEGFSAERSLHRPDGGSAS